MNTGRFAASGLVWLICFLALCSPAAGPFGFSNNSPVLISDGNSPPTKASPYPSAITVSGLQGFSISRITVTLKGLTHDYPSDVAVLLVGPGGQQSLLMADCGGTPMPYPVTNIDLKFDDAAAKNLPVRQSLSTGSFKPTNGYEWLGSSLGYDFPNVPGSMGAEATLAHFNNASPNGTWSLYVVDDAGGGGSGIISAGWELAIWAGVPLKAQLAQGQIVLSWPESAYTLKLQESANSGSGWSDAGVYPVRSSGQCWVTNPVTAGPKFFRLSL